MTRLALLLRLMAWQLRLLLRDRQLLFWNVGFFVIALLLFLGLLSGGDAAVRVSLAAALVTTAVAANALFGIAVGLTSARQRGVFRRYAVTPAPAGLVLSVAVAGRALIVAAAGATLVVVAALLFDLPWTGGAPAWMAMVTAGTLAFTGIGCAIAAVAGAPHVANTMANLVFMPMIALGGTALPASMMPEAWTRVHWVLPTATMFDGLLGAFVRGETAADNLPRIGYLVLWAAAASGFAAYRWSRDVA